MRDMITRARPGVARRFMDNEADLPFLIGQSFGSMRVKRLSHLRMWIPPISRWCPIGGSIILDGGGRFLRLSGREPKARLSACTLKSTSRNRVCAIKAPVRTGIC